MKNNVFYTKDYNYFLNKIINNNHFKYSRFNDGEINAISGNIPNGSNCDGHRYFPEMGRELKAILVNYKFSENYIIESYDYWYYSLSNVRGVIDEIKNINKNLKLLNYDFIRIMHERDTSKFIELLEMLKHKNLVLVGPKYLKNLNRFFKFDFIEVPLKNCYLDKDRIIHEMKIIDDQKENMFFLLSASMPSKIFIHQMSDNKNTFIDWGSVWDTFFISKEFSFIRKRSSSKHNKYKEIYKDWLI